MTPMTQSFYQGFPPPSGHAPPRANYGGYAAPPIDPQRGGPMSMGANWSSRMAQPVQPDYSSQKSCFRCGEPGHYARDCPTNRAPGWEEKRKLAARKPSSKIKILPPKVVGPLPKVANPLVKLAHPVRKPARLALKEARPIRPAFLFSPSLFPRRPTLLLPQKKTGTWKRHLKRNL